MVLEKIFLIGQSQTELPMVAIFVVRLAQNMTILHRTSHTSFLICLFTELKSAASAAQQQII